MIRRKITDTVAMLYKGIAKCKPIKGKKKNSNKYHKEFNLSAYILQELPGIIVR